MFTYNPNSYLCHFPGFLISERLNRPNLSSKRYGQNSFSANRKANKLYDDLITPSSFNYRDRFHFSCITPISILQLTWRCRLKYDFAFRKCFFASAYFLITRFLPCPDFPIEPSLSLFSSLPKNFQG